MKIKVSGKPVKVWINGVLCFLSAIRSAPLPPTPPSPGEYSSLVDHAITDKSKTASVVPSSSSIGEATIGTATIA